MAVVSWRRTLDSLKKNPIILVEKADENEIEFIDDIGER